MAEGHNSLFLFTEPFGDMPAGMLAAMILIPVAIIAIIIVAVIKKKKRTTAKPAEAALVVEKNTTATAEKMTAPAAAIPTVQAAAIHATSQPAANILIIEDDSIMLLAIRSILAKSGYNLITAKDGKEAFEKLDSEEYDVVVTDLMMPYANGLEVVSKIRNDISKRHVSIIVCSSVGNEETITEAFRLGADDYLKKPIKAEELLMRVKNLLDRRTNNPKLVTKKTTRANV